MSDARLAGVADFDFDAVAELLVRDHAEHPDADVRAAIAFQLRRAYEAGRLGGSIEAAHALLRTDEPDDGPGY